MDFELHRNDLHTSRFLHSDPPSPRDGEALLRVESFGLTSNNITYAVFGEAIRKKGEFHVRVQGKLENADDARKFTEDVARLKEMAIAERMG